MMMNRLKIAFVSLASSMLLSTGSVCADSFNEQLKTVLKEPALQRDYHAAQRRGWEVGITLWSWGGYDLRDQLRLSKHLNVEFIEMGPHYAPIKGGTKTPLTHLDSAQRRELRSILDEFGLPLKQLYVHAPKGRDAWVEWFECAQEWGVDTLVGEPFYEDFSMLDELTQRYGIRIAIHNHPSSKNRYWKPDLALPYLQQVNPLIGLNPDLGHWIRMGVDPAVEMARPEVASRILAFHYNDVLELGVPRSPHCEPGAGAGNIEQMLETLSEAGFRGRFTIEQGNWGNSYGEIRAGVQLIDQVASGAR